MNTYAIYDTTTGAVRWFMTSTPDHIDVSIPQGCGWIEIEEAPAGGWHVDLTTKGLVSGALDLRTLDQAKADKRAELKESRTDVVYSTFVWSGSPFDCNADSQALIQGAVLDSLVAAQLAQPFSVDWTLADNTVRTLSGSDVIQVGLAMSAWIRTNFSKGQALQSSIAAATSVAQLESIQWA